MQNGSPGRKRCFLLLPRPVFPVVSGYSLKNYNLVRILAEKYRLKVGIISPGPLSEEEKEYLRGLGVRWFTFRLPKWKSILRTAAGIFSGRPLQVSYYYDPALKRKVDRELSGTDVAIAALIRTRAYLPSAGKAYASGGGTEKRPEIVFDMVDSIAMNYARSEAQTASLFWRLIYRIERKRLEAFERKYVKESDVTFLFNPEEAKALEPYGHVVCVPHGVDSKLFSYTGPGSENVDSDSKSGTGDSELKGGGTNDSESMDGAVPPVVFLGKMDYQPNVDAVLWYLHEVHPRLTGKIPFRIVGAYPKESVIKAAEAFPDVTVTGFVEDPYRDASEALCMAAPMQSGGGIQNKVLEGMALGKVNLVSPLAAAALPDVEDGRELWILKTPDEYTDRILALREEWLKAAGKDGAAGEKAAGEAAGEAAGKAAGETAGETAAAMGLRARAYIRERFTWEKYGERYLREL